MKIVGPNPMLPNSAIRRTGRTDRRPGADFAGHLQPGEEATMAPSVGVGSTPTIDSLLSLQEVPEDPRRRRRAMQRGMDLLDRLDDIRIALLSGGMPQEQLKRLAEALKGRKESVADPKLAQILDEIEIRAAVELAKLEQIQ
jgi:hypothetical protein